jgi:hypothetical protein
LGADIGFYTVADDRFFPAAVGLVNSLRLMGYEERVVLLDCGLTQHQRGVLGSECELVAPPDQQPINPQLLKPFAHLLNPTGVVVMLDSDLIVTRRLDQFLEAARNGRVCVYAYPEARRWFAEWEGLFRLSAPPRHQPYVLSGFVAFSVEHWPDLLGRWWESCQRIRSNSTTFYGAPDNPTAQADQDALNAILMSEVPREGLFVLPDEALPSMEQHRRRVQVLDTGTLSCTLDGRPVTFVHPSVKVKPFERQWWTDQGRSPYPIFLRRLLAGPDVRVRVLESDVPIWLQSGRRGALASRLLRVVNARLDPVRLALHRLGVRSWARVALTRFSAGRD